MFNELGFNNYYAHQWTRSLKSNYFLSEQTRDLKLAMSKFLVDLALRAFNKLTVNLLQLETFFSISVNIGSSEWA